MSSATFVGGRGLDRPKSRQVAGRRQVLSPPRLRVAVAAAAVAALPLLRPSGPANSAPVDLLVALALILSVYGGVGNGERWRFPYAFPMLLFLGGGAIGALAGPVPINGLSALVQDVVLLTWCWTLTNICRSASSLRVVTRAWAYGSIVWGILLFVGLATGTAALTGRTTKDASRTMLTFGDPNVAANFLFISIMVIWATQIPRHRSLRLTGYALLVAAMVTTGSNSGLVSIIVGVMVAGFLGLYRRAGAVAAVTMICFALCGLYAVGSNINLISIQDRAQASRWSFIRDGIGRQESSVEQRGSILHESLHLYQVGGPFGAGPASTKPRLQAEQAPFVKEAHDDYLAALTERGLIGLLGVALLVGGVALQAIALVRRRLTPDFAAVIVRPNALVGAIAGTLLTMTVVELLHARHVWTLFAVVAALSLWGGDRVAHKTRKRT